MKKRLFVDMDGTLTTFKYEAMEKLEEKGYFLNLEPHENVLNSIKEIINSREDIEVYILSAVLNTPYAENEKNQWLDKHIPEIPYENRIFTECGVDKRNFIKGGVCINDTLLDDYTVNLNKWDKTGTAIKLGNDINGTKGTWQGPRVDFKDEELNLNILKIIDENYLELENKHIEFIKNNNEVTTYKDFLILRDICEYNKEFLNIIESNEREIKFEITELGYDFVNDFGILEINQGYEIEDLEYEDMEL